MELVPALGLIALLLVKEAGVPVPVPGDLLVLGAGIAAAGAGVAAGGSAIPAPVLLGAILAAGVVGGCVQFALVRGAFREPLLRALTRFGVPRQRLDGLAGWLRQRGARGVAVASVTPGVRVGATAASGLAALPFGSFLPGLVVGNALFVGGHFALGYVAGPAAMDVLVQGGGIALGVAAFVLLAVVGLVAWQALRRRKLEASGGKPHAHRRLGLPRDLASLATWSEAGVSRLPRGLAGSTEPGVNVIFLSPHLRPGMYLYVQRLNAVGATVLVAQWHVPELLSVNVPPATGMKSDDHEPGASRSRSTPCVALWRTTLLACTSSMAYRRRPPVPTTNWTRPRSGSASPPAVWGENRS